MQMDFLVEGRGGTLIEQHCYIVAMMMLHSDHID